MPSSILFRVDASRTIGLGHVSRCMTLAQAFTDAGHRCSFLASTEGSLVEQALRGRFPFTTQDFVPGSGEDIRATAELQADLTVVDGYVFSADYLRQLSVSRRVCFIDDLINMRFDCAAVLNHNLYAFPQRFDTRTGCELIVGPRFALVGEAFSRAREERSAVARADANRVLVTLGGADALGDTVKVMDALERVRVRSLEVRVVVGMANARRAEIEASAHGSRHKVEVLVDAPSLAPHMAWADVAISAGGTTFLELGVVGVPCLVLVLAQNQLESVLTGVTLGVTRSLGDRGQVTPEQVASELEELLIDVVAREQMSRKQRAQFDGHGPRRAVQRLNAVLQSEAPR